MNSFASNLRLVALALPLLATLALADAPAVSPKPVSGLLVARPFRLEQPYRTDWRAERPEVRTGYILVLEIDRALLRPRQTAEPVLYVGKQVAERINVGQDSGRLVVLVPGDVDLKNAPIWFGSPRLPEQVTSDIITTEREQADRAAVRPPDGATVDRALAAGGKPLVVSDKGALLRELVPLLRAHAPTEKDLADALAMSPPATQQ